MKTDDETENETDWKHARDPTHTNRMQTDDETENETDWKHAGN